MTGTETKAGKLRELQRLGLTDAKTYSKGAAAVWADYTKTFPKGLPEKSVFIKASAEARRACASVNMRVIGSAVVFPAGTGGTAKIRETKNGVFIDYGLKGKKLDTIILSKKGDHIKYGMKLAKRNMARADPDNVSQVYGTLKVSNYKSGSVDVHTFQRDTARLYENPLNALLDDRYATDKLELDRETLRVDSDFIDLLKETNGVAALIVSHW